MTRRIQLNATTALLAIAALLVPVDSYADDWPQWRGANRDGVSAGEAVLSNTWPTEGPEKIWQSEAEIPSDDDGGHGSPVVADGKVYLSVVWHTDVPTETRRIDVRCDASNFGPVYVTY